MAGDLKPGIETFEFYLLPRAISKFQYGSRPQTKPNQMKGRRKQFKKKKKSQKEKNLGK